MKSLLAYFSKCLMIEKEFKYENASLASTLIANVGLYLSKM
jgi:hypothetical protein